MLQPIKFRALNLHSLLTRTLIDLISSLKNLLCNGNVIVSEAVKHAFLKIYLLQTDLGEAMR